MGKRILSGLWLGRKTLLMAILAFFLSAPSVSADTLKPTKKVLLIHSFEPFLPYAITVTQSIQAAFQSDQSFQVDLYTEYLDLARFPGEEYRRRLLEHIRYKYLKKSVDLIVVTLFPALDILLKDGEKFFPGVPIVFCTIEEQQIKLLPLRANITGVAADVDAKKTLEAALRLQPGTRKVIVIGGAHQNDKAAEVPVRQALKEYEGRLDITYLTGTAMETILKTVSGLPEDSIVLYMTIFQDGSGKSFVPREAATLISRTSNAPVYSLFGSYLGYGIVGGRLISFEEQGKKAAEMGLRILHGQRPAELPILTSPNIYQFDWRQLKRWNIRESRLPPDSRVMFKKRTLWAEYKWAIVGVFAFGVIESVLIVILLTQRVRRRRIEEALRENQRSMETLLSNLPGMACRCRNDRQWTMEFVSQGSLPLTGYVPEDLIGNARISFNELIHPDDQEFVWEETQKALMSRRHFQFNYRIRTAAGTVKWVWEQGCGVFHKDSSLIALEGFIVDITERKRAEGEIRRLNAELEQRVRDRTAQLEAANRELETFSYSVSHDLRAPLRHLAGFVNLLNKEAPEGLDEKSRHYMKVISDSAIKMARLIDDILSFSRMGRVEMMRSRVDMAFLVEEVLKMIQPDLKDREIVWSIGELPEVYGDPAMLKTVWTNLVSNAVKFTGRECRAVIEIGHIADQVDEDHFYIKDNGAGFDMRYGDKLFGLFQRLHREDEFEGTGLGLANIRRIISRHGGRTWAEGGVEEGATFYFSLPKRRCE